MQRTQGPALSKLDFCVWDVTMHGGPAVPPGPHLLISRVCTPYLLSILYLPGSAAWQIKLPSLYLHEGNTHFRAKKDRFCILSQLSLPSLSSCKGLLLASRAGGRLGRSYGKAQGPHLQCRREAPAEVRPPRQPPPVTVCAQSQNLC